MVFKTGLSTPKANIYDMGGNVGEYTTELNPNTTEPVIIRGGHYDLYSAAYRIYTVAWGKSKDYGFRTTLFLK